MKKDYQKFWSPKGGKRGCLCEDKKTYDSKCCDGSLQAQGVGQLDNEVISTYNNTNTQRIINN